jgi:hypothetical protein
MKYLKKYKLFENLESKIDLQELESILIDFKQMGLEGLDIDIKVGSSIVIDWNLFNDDRTGGSKCLHSSDIDKYTKSRTSNSLTIEFNTSEPDTYNIEETSEAYEMLKDYLFDNYNLIPNYIYITSHWNYMYFEDFDKIKELRVTDNWQIKWEWQFSYDKLPVRPENTFKAHKLVFGFYLDPNAVFRGSEF